MVLKSVFIAIICTMLSAWSGLSMADEYRPDEFLGLDLTGALLSPKPLGPPSQFVPGPLDARIDRPDEGAQASVEPKEEPRTEPTVVVPRTRVVTRVVHARAEKPKEEPKAESKVVVPRMRIATRIAHVHAAKPRAVARTRLARRHTNPLDAQAFDTRIQVWPCKSGGICNWKR
jgi:hypothetical protein